MATQQSQEDRQMHPIFTCIHRKSVLDRLCANSSQTQCDCFKNFRNHFSHELSTTLVIEIWAFSGILSLTLSSESSLSDFLKYESCVHANSSVKLGSPWENVQLEWDVQLWVSEIRGMTSQLDRISSISCSLELPNKTFIDFWNTPGQKETGFGYLTQRESLARCHQHCSSKTLTISSFIHSLPKSNWANNKKVKEAGQ